MFFIYSIIKYYSMETTNSSNIIKSIDNDMQPRFGHTITLGKYFLFVKFFLTQFYLLF
jgi:hypothetical protein